MGLEVTALDFSVAFDAARPIRMFNWWVRDRKPTRLVSFSQEVVASARRLQPDWVLATGLPPLTTKALSSLRQLGSQTLLFLTDDPWNPAHRSQWFLRTLPLYD